MSDQLSDIGLIGLAVMGQNLALNIADHGFKISVYNRTTSTMEKFVAENPDTPGGLVGFATMEEFAASLKRPRRAVIMVQAGNATDAVITALTQVFEPGDIIIDGGNAKWTDTTDMDNFRADGSGDLEVDSEKATGYGNTVHTSSLTTTAAPRPPPRILRSCPRART